MLTRDQLNSLNSSMSQLRISLDLLQAKVNAVTQHINNTVSNPLCEGCDVLRPELQKLMLDTTFSVSPHFNRTLSRHILDASARLLPPADRSKYFSLYCMWSQWWHVSDSACPPPRAPI